MANIDLAQELDVLKKQEQILRDLIKNLEFQQHRLQSEAQALEFMLEDSNLKSAETQETQQIEESSSIEQATKLQLEINLNPNAALNRNQQKYEEEEEDEDDDDDDDSENSQKAKKFTIL